jgi:hypothetical protein
MSCFYEFPINTPNARSFFSNFKKKKKKRMKEEERKKSKQWTKPRRQWLPTPACKAVTMVRSQCPEPQGSFQTPLDPVTSWVIKRHYSSVSLTGAECISIDRYICP